MTQPRFDLTSLRKAVASLQGALGVVGDSTWFNQQSPAVQDTLPAGVIQNFEVVYELSIKMIRPQIELQSDSLGDIDRTGFRDMLRIAAEQGLLSDVERWFGYRGMRDLSVQEKARQVYRDTLALMADARCLLAELEARNG